MLSMLSPVFEETEAGEQLIQLRGDVPAPGARPDQLQPPPVHRHIGLPDLDNAATRIQNKYREKDQERIGLFDIDLGIGPKIARIVLEILTF